MAGTDQDSRTVEKFAQNGGNVIAVLGGLVVAAFVVTWLVDRDHVPLWLPALALFGGALLHASTVRPRVLVRGGDLVLRNMVSSVVIPLAAVEELAVRQLLAVRAGGRRYVCAGVGRSLRQAMRGSALERAREQMGGLHAELPTTPEPGMAYADFVELRLQELIREDRVRRGIERFSPQVGELGEHVRREPAWLEVGALVATGVLAVLAIVAG